LKIQDGGSHHNQFTKVSISLDFYEDTGTKFGRKMQLDITEMTR